MVTNDTAPPILRNPEAEAAVLGTMIHNNDMVWSVQEILTADDFHAVKNQQVFNAIITLLKDTQQCDPVTLHTYLTRFSQNGVAWGDYASQLMELSPDVDGALVYAKLVAEMATRRKLVSLGKQIDRVARDQETPIDESMSKVEGLAFGIRNRHDTGGIQMPQQVMEVYERRQERLRHRTGEILGLPTGWSEVDWLLDGLQKKYVYVMAGRPGMGKSAAALNIAKHLTMKHKKYVAFFSLEMNHGQIIQRLTAAITGIDSKIIRKPWKYQDRQWPIILQAQKELKNNRLYVDDTPRMRPSQIYARSMKQKALYGLDLIIIDHFHLMKSDTQRRDKRVEFNEVAEAMPEIAKSLNVPILLLAQLNRSVESRQDKRPLLSDFKETGTLEEIAYAGLLLYRDEYYNPGTTETPNQGEINIAKHREGATGMVNLFWDAPTTQFKNLAKENVRL